MKSRRGIALLIVLIAMCLVLSLVAAAVTSMDLARASITADRTDISLWSGAQDGERLAITWLSRYATQAVTNPEEAEAGFTIVDDAYDTAQGNGRLRVVLFDGLSGIPAHLVATGSPLRLALPAHLLSLNLPTIEAPKPGQAIDVLERLTIQGRDPVFPRPDWSTTPVLWQSSEATLGFGDARQSRSESGVSAAVAISPHSDGRININTAPAALLQAAFATLGRSGVDEILASRRRGVFSGLTRDGQPAGANGVQLVTASDCWNALITVSWAGRTRSWWTVLASNQGGFARVQRHAVPP